MATMEKNKYKLGFFYNFKSRLFEIQFLLKQNLLFNDLNGNGLEAFYEQLIYRFFPKK